MCIVFMTRLPTSARLILSRTRQDNLVASRVKDVKEGTDICL